MGSLRQEVGYSTKVKEPIDWMLLTTVKTESFEEACERLTWYSDAGDRGLSSHDQEWMPDEDRRLDDAQSWKRAWPLILWWLADLRSDYGGS